MAIAGPGKPSVTVKNTKPANQGWSTSGTVQFSISAMDMPDATMSFEFDDAASERAAVQMAARQMLLVSQEFQKIAEFYLRSP